MISPGAVMLFILGLFIASTPFLTDDPEAGIFWLIGIPVAFVAVAAQFMHQGNRRDDYEAEDEARTEEWEAAKIESTQGPDHELQPGEPALDLLESSGRRKR